MYVCMSVCTFTLCAVVCMNNIKKYPCADLPHQNLVLGVLQRAHAYRLHVVDRRLLYSRECIDCGAHTYTYIYIHTYTLIYTVQ